MDVSIIVEINTYGKRGREARPNKLVYPFLGALILAE